LDLPFMTTRPDERDLSSLEAWAASLEKRYVMVAQRHGFPVDGRLLRDLREFSKQEIRRPAEDTPEAARFGELLVVAPSQLDPRTEGPFDGVECHHVAVTG